MSESNFDYLSGEKYISLTTFRRSGKAVPTPVEFAEESGKLYVSTRAHSGKVKRIRNNNKGKIAPCTMRGKITGTDMVVIVHILPDTEEEIAKQALRRKYNNLLYRIMSNLPKLLVWRKEVPRVYLEIIASNS